MHKPHIEPNLANTLLRRAQINPERTALIFEELTLTYKELGLRVRQQAALLQANGVCIGDRVGFVGFNHPAFLETLFAANAIGAIFVPLNFRLTAKELTYIINNAGVHTLICDDEMQLVIDPVKSALCCQQYFGATSTLDGWRALQEERMTVEPLPSIVSVDQHDTSIIMYTSGTTGLPKGAMLTHGNLMWNNINSQVTFGGSRDDVILTAAPLFHIGGLNVLTLHCFTLGSTLVLIRNFDAGTVLNAFSKYKVTHMFGAPAMFLFMSQHPGFDNTDFSKVETFVCGGAAPSASLLTLYSKRNVSFCQGYGLTETAPFSTLLTAEWAMSKLGSAGQPPMYTQVKIVGKDNASLPAGENGEICISGPNVMKGYWNNPAASTEAIDSEGWFHSGDVGYLDDDGFLYICDRLKDMLISGGENIYPAEIESVLASHEAIAEVAVLGMPDEKWGEAVTAIVVLHKGRKLTIDELRSFSEEHLARYKLPQHLHLIDVLPRNPAGKVLKYVLKEQLSS